MGWVQRYSKNLVHLIFVSNYFHEQIFIINLLQPGHFGVEGLTVHGNPYMWWYPKKKFSRSKFDRGFCYYKLISSMIY